MEKRAKKIHFSETEIEVLVGEVEGRKDVLFGGHSGITNKRKSSEWQQVSAAVNSVAPQDTPQNKR